MKLVEGTCVEDPKQLQSISPVDAINETPLAINKKRESTKANVLVYENVSGELVLDQSSQTVHSKHKLSTKVETMILKE